MRYQSEIHLRHSWDVCKLVPNLCNFLCYCLHLCYHTSLKKFAISHIFSSEWGIFLKLFGDIMRSLYTRSNIFKISYVSANLVVDLLPQRYEAKIAITPVLGKTSFWSFLEAFVGCLHTSSKLVQFFVCL